MRNEFISIDIVTCVNLVTFVALVRCVCACVRAFGANFVSRSQAGNESNYVGKTGVCMCLAIVSVLLVKSISCSG